MKPITIAKATKLTSPNLVMLVCTQTLENKTNLATVSWWMPLSFNPAMITFAMQKAAYSGELTRKNKRVVVAVPGAELSDIVMKCGSTSGRDVDKVEKYNIEMKSINDCSIQVPVHSRLVFDCSLSETIEAGDHYLYICNVENVFADENEEAVFAWDGYASVKPLSQK